MAEARTRRIAAPQPKSAEGSAIKPGLVCTFYSYKGGVGRSMSLANVAVLLSRWGQRVLLIDWDLEAPGLERFFGPRVRGSRASKPGLIDLIGSYDAANAGATRSPLDWRECRLSVSIPQGKSIDIIHAGREGPTYANLLRALNWDSLFAQDFGRELERIRGEWKREYDYVLIDSRTGITDIGGICSILLPDYLVSFFTTTEQSVLGVKDAMTRARDAQQKLPLDRQRLIIIPIAARDESNSEYERAAEWRKRFARELSGFYDDWIDKEETPESVLNYLKIPYVAFWSFGETLPVLEEDSDNPKMLAYSYALIARLIHGRLNWAEVREGREATELQAQRTAEVQSRLAEANKARIEAINQQQAEAERVLEKRKNLLQERFERLTFELKHKRDIINACLATSAAVFVALLIVFFWINRNYDVVRLDVPNIIVGGAALLALAAVVWSGLRRIRTARVIAALDREHAAYTIGHGRYAEVTGETGLRIFADRIEHIVQDRDPGAPGLPSPDVASFGVPIPGATSLPAPLALPAGNASPPAPVAADLTSAPLSASDDRSPIDVFFSAPSTGISRDWMIEFMPLFVQWLSEMLGRDVSIFSTVTVAGGEQWGDAVNRAIARARSAIVILSRRNLQSQQGRGELRALLDGLSLQQIFPLRLESIRPDDLPPGLNSIQWTDFSDVAYVGEGFAKSERYIEFQDRIRALAEQVAAAIEKSEEQPAQSLQQA